MGVNGRHATSAGWDDSSVQTLDDLNEYIGFLFRRSQQAHVAVWSTEVSTETTSIQFGVLNALAREPGSSQRAIGDALDLDRTTIGEVAARLEQRGLIVRKRDDADRRRNVLDLTETGRAELALLLPRSRRVDQLLTRNLSAEDREHLRSLLNRALSAVPSPDHGSAQVVRRR